MQNNQPYPSMYLNLKNSMNTIQKMLFYDVSDLLPLFTPPYSPFHSALE